jgi:hypothetical protein
MKRAAQRIRGTNCDAICPAGAGKRGVSGEASIGSHHAHQMIQRQPSTIVEDRASHAPRWSTMQADFHRGAVNAAAGVARLLALVSTARHAVGQSYFAALAAAARKVEVRAGCFRVPVDGAVDDQFAGRDGGGTIVRDTASLKKARSRKLCLSQEQASWSMRRAGRQPLRMRTGLPSGGPCLRFPPARPLLPEARSTCAGKRLNGSNYVAMDELEPEHRSAGQQ